MSKQSKNILIISFSDLSRDPRVHRQLVYFLNKGYKITTLAEGASQFKKIEFLDCELTPQEKRIPLGRVKRALKTLMRCYESIYWSTPRIKKALSLLKNREFDLIVANDIDALPLAVKVSRGKKILFDSHEYAPKEFEDQWRWRLLFQGFRDYICKKYLSKATFRITVCQGIADEYRKNYSSRFHVITNAVFYEELKPVLTKENKIKMIYHGCASPSRSVEEVFKIMKLLDNRFQLDLILIAGCQDYIDKMGEIAKNHSNIRLIPPVSMLNISKLCNNYDIGFFPLIPTNLNYFFGLGNKFFEFIQARVLIAMSPLPEMAHYIRKYSVGVVAEDFSPESFAKILNQLTKDEIWQMKFNADKAAKELNAENNFKKLDEVLSESH